MLKTIYSYIKLSRPYYVLPVIATSTAGYYSVPTIHSTFLGGIIVGFVFFLLGMASWAANEITDRELDAKGKSKKKWGLYVSGGTSILSSEIVSVKSTISYIFALAITGLFIAYLIGTTFFILSILFLTFGLTYSLRPIRLKDRGILGLASVSLAYGLVAFLAGCISGCQIPNFECIFFAIMLTIYFFGFEGLAHLLDHEQDLRNEENTISVSLGKKMTRKVLAFCQCLPGLVLLLFSLISNSIFPNLNLVLLFPLFFISCLIALIILKYQQDSLTSSLVVLGIPLMSIFAFLLV